MWNPTRQQRTVDFVINLQISFDKSYQIVNHQLSGANKNRHNSISCRQSWSGTARVTRSRGFPLLTTMNARGPVWEPSASANEPLTETKPLLTLPGVARHKANRL